MCVYQRSSKYQFHNLWLDPTKARTHIPSHTRRGRLLPPSIYFLQYDLNSKVTIVSLFCLPTSSVYNLRLNDGKDPLLCFCITSTSIVHMIILTSGAGTAYPSGAPEFTPGFSGVRVTRSLVLCVCFVDRCWSFCTFSFGHCIVLLRYMDSDYPFGIFKIFLCIKFKLMAQRSENNTVIQLNMRVSMLLICRRHVHDGIISLRWEFGSIKQV
jgi:hypothetical protein